MALRTGRSASSSSTPANRRRHRILFPGLKTGRNYRRRSAISAAAGLFLASPPSSKHRWASRTARYAESHRRLCRRHRRLRPFPAMRRPPMGSQRSPQHFLGWPHHSTHRCLPPTPSTSSPVPPDRLHPAPVAAAFSSLPRLTDRLFA